MSSVISTENFNFVVISIPCRKDNYFVRSLIDFSVEDIVNLKGHFLDICLLVCRNGMRNTREQLVVVAV